MGLLPTHPHSVSDHHVQGEIIVELHVGIGLHEGHQ